MNLENQQSGKNIFSNKLLLHVAVSYAALLIILSHRVDDFLNPQFFAEDGSKWFADAYTNGLSSLFVPVSYYQTIPRLVGLFSQLFPMTVAPAVFTLSAIAMKLVVVNFLATSRLSNVIPQLSVRLLLGFIYLAAPNTWEVTANVSNFHWHSGLLMFLIIVAIPSKKRGWKIFDAVIVAVSSVSGPFSIFLVPIAFIHWFFKREKWTLLLLGILLTGALTQFYGMSFGDRPQAEKFDLSFKFFSRIIGGQIFVTSIIGSRGYEKLINYNLWKDLTVTVANLVGFGLMIYAAFKSKLELKLFILFATFIVVASLIAAFPNDDKIVHWENMYQPNSQGRYWFIPTLCSLITLLYLGFNAKTKIIKTTALILLLLTPIGIAIDWQYPSFREGEFYKQLREFEAADPGTEMTIRVPPNWKMTLKKK